jgi:hypothetical protein
VKSNIGDRTCWRKLVCALENVEERKSVRRRVGLRVRTMARDGAWKDMVRDLRLLWK